MAPHAVWLTLRQQEGPLLRRDAPSVDVARQVFAEGKDPFRLAVVCQHAPQMVFDHLRQLAARDGRTQAAAEDPGISHGGAPDEHRVTAGFHQAPRGFIVRADVSVSQDGDAGAGLDLRNRLPVGFSAVSLGPSPAMDGEQSRPVLLDGARHEQVVALGLVPPEAYFGADGNLER